MFSQKMIFKRAEQMEVSWSKVGAIHRMLKDFSLDISQPLICLVIRMGTRVVMQEQLREVHAYLHGDIIKTKPLY
jgi:hypothetical protein